MVEAVLSDIDGTLVESNWLHAAAWRDAFAVIDIPFDIETLRKQMGKGGDQLIPVFVPWWKRPMVEEPLKTYHSFLFHQDYFHHVTPLPRVRDTQASADQTDRASNAGANGTPARGWYSVCHATSLRPALVESGRAIFGGDPCPGSVAASLRHHAHPHERSHPHL